MNNQTQKNVIIFVCLAVILIGFAINVLFVAFNQTDNFLDGYDHPVIPVLLDVYDHNHPFGDDFTISGHGRAVTTHIRLSMTLVELFGLNIFTLFVVQAIAFLLMLIFAFLIAKELADDALAGWIAAAMLSMAPLCYALLRTYTYWPFMLAFFFGVILATLRYHRTPTWWRAVLIGLMFSLLTSATYDRTSMHLVMFNGYAFIAMVFIERFISLKPQRRWIVGHAALTFFASIIELFFRYLKSTLNLSLDSREAISIALLSMVQFFNPASLADYQQQAIEDTVVSAPWGATIPSYLSDWFFHGMGPIIFLVVLLTAVSAFYLIRPKQHLLWWILPIVLLAMLSTIPRKAPWFTQFLGGYFIILAAVTLMAWVKRFRPKQQTLLLLVCLSLFLGQYLFFSFVHVLHVPRWAAPIPCANSPPCTSTVFTSDPKTEFIMTRVFLAKYHELFGSQKSIRLMPIYLSTHPSILEFYLRTQAPQISLHNLKDWQDVDVIFWMEHPTSPVVKNELIQIYKQGNSPRIFQILTDNWRATYRFQYKAEPPTEMVEAFREKIATARVEILSDYNFLFIWPKE